MQLTTFAQYGDQIQTLIAAATSSQVQSTVDQLIDQEQWELLGTLLPTVSEVAARRIVTGLIEKQVYEPLAPAACLRRQLRPTVSAVATGGIAGRVFRDFDAEDDTAGVPEHILADAQEMSQAADRQRQSAVQRDARVDRDPVRAYIVGQLAKQLGDGSAREVMLTIIKASAWEETRREAALKLVNHKPSVQQLLADQRSEDLIAVSNATGLQAVATTMATSLGEKLPEWEQAGDSHALEFVAENHPDADIRAAAQQALGGR